MSSTNIKVEENYNYSLKLIERLNEFLKAEASAIDKLDDKKLQEYGDKIEKLLNDLSTHLPDRKELTAEQSEKLCHLLGDIKNCREKNKLFLEEVLEKSGHTLNRLAKGRQTLKAYKGMKQGNQELFLKKKC